MRLQDFYYSLYSPLIGQGKLCSFLRFFIRCIANFHLRIHFSISTSLSTTIDSGTIVSLTSFPARIEYAWIAIESIIRQQIRPERILLWLSADQFDSIDSLPSKLQKQQKYGLEIRIVNGDVRSHKKYTYAFKEYPNKRIILIDDDIIYRSDFLKKLVEEYKSSIWEKRIVCYYALHKKYDTLGQLLPYKAWIKEFDESSEEDLFFGSGGGIISMACDYYVDLTDIDLAMKLTPTADDIWLNAMSKLANAKIIKIGHGLFLPVIIEGNEDLFRINNLENKNDEQLQNIIKYYDRLVL